MGSLRVGACHQEKIRVFLRVFIPLSTIQFSSRGILLHSHGGSSFT
jgi:hypothetical protein